MAEEQANTLNIVVLGASFAGLAVAHHFLDHTLHSLRTNFRKTSVRPTYRLVLISPSTHMYYNIAAPRVLVETGLADEHSPCFVPIEPAFQRHKHSHKDKNAATFVFIQASAVAWNPQDRTLRIEPIGARAEKRAAQLGRSCRSDADASTQAQARAQYSVPYHALVIATGSGARSDLLSLHGPHTDTVARLREFHARVAEASSIVIGGGGASGVEVAGRLAVYLNQQAGVSGRMLGKSQDGGRRGGRKRIRLIMASGRALPGLPEELGLKAERHLQGLGVELVKEKRVERVTEDFGEQGKTQLALSDGTNLLVDVYVPATGVLPNTQFVPERLLDDRGYVRTDAKTLRVDEAGQRVYAVGDCASYSLNYLADVYFAVTPMMTNLAKDLWAWEVRKANPYNANEDEIADVADQLCERDGAIKSQLCPITRRGGVGILFGRSIPSVMVHWLKGRDYMVSKAERAATHGQSPY